MSKEEFEILLKSILDSNKGLTQEGIAIELEYNEGYISQMLNRILEMKSPIFIMLIEK